MTAKDDFIDNNEPPDEVDAAWLNEVAKAVNSAVNTQTDDYTLALDDAGEIIIMDKSSPVNLTVPPNSSVAFPIPTTIPAVVQAGDGQVLIVAGEGVTLRPPSVESKTRAKWAKGQLDKIGADTWLISGDMVYGPPTGPPAVPPPHPFFVVQEYIHDGGTIATQQSTDLGLEAASFRAILTSAEASFLSTHHSTFVYFCLPQNLIQSSVPPNYLSTLDPNYVNTMRSYVTAYGIDRMYLFAMPEWDNDPANTGWAYNRFSEAGVGGDRPDLPTGLTRQQAYDQYLHFYLDDNHDGNTNHHQLGQILNVDYMIRGYKVQANCQFAGTCFWAYQMGVDQVTLQRSNDDISGLIGSTGFVRGAASQYGKEWGWDVSFWRSRWNAGATAYDAGHNLIHGWSAETLSRHLHIMFASGADVIMTEGVDCNTNGWVNINGRLYTATGTALRDFCNYALTRHPDRGTPHVPITIMKDHISFWEPLYGEWNQNRAVWYQQMSANNGENMLYNLWDAIYPDYNDWGTSLTTAEPLGSARWGEQFDVCTEEITSEVLEANYRAVIVSMNTAMDGDLQTILADFATAGGIVVLNAKQLSGSGHETMTGLEITGTASASGTITWDGDSSTTTEGNYNYSTCTLDTATVLAHSGTNTPQVTTNTVGSGEVWVVMPDWMSNAANNTLLELGEKIIQVLVDQFQEAWLVAPSHSFYDYSVNVNAGTGETTTTVTLVNTHVSGTTLTATVVVPSTATPVQEWVTDTTPSYVTNGPNTEISASVPGGSVRVYAVG